MPIPGSTKIERIEENVRALEISLAPDDLQTLDLLATNRGRRSLHRRRDEGGQSVNRSSRDQGLFWLHSALRISRDA